MENSVNDATETKEHTIKIIEKDYHGKLINENILMSMGYNDLVRWLKKIAKYENIKRTMLIVDQGERIKIIFFTATYKYSINARKDNYLGCTASCRKARPGETWTRGSDLPDGNYDEETFEKIVRKIVGYEMKNLQLEI